MRQALLVVHRWFGLAAAVFLFVAGATGALISWDHELDGWLNSHLYEARGAGPARPALELAERIEAADPRVRVSYLPLAAEPGQALLVSVQPRIDGRTGQPFAVGYNQVAIDPASGEIQGRRMWGEISLERENLLPFLYKLHYSMHLPESGGIEWGVWLMGLIAIAWFVDCFIALALSFPSRASWRKSFTFRWHKGGYALSFDLHRSGGVWLWVLVLLVALTSIGMNLRNEVMRPVVNALSPLSPSPFDGRTAEAQAAEPAISRAQAIALGEAQARQRGWEAPAGGVFYSAETGVWGVGFFAPGDGHGDGGLGNPWLYFDARTGAPAGADVPGTGSAGDVFMQLQFPVHSGRIAGLPGRVLMSLLGVAVATLSVTGVVIWVRKRRARLHLRMPASAALEAGTS